MDETTEAQRTLDAATILAHLQQEREQALAQARAYREEAARAEGRAEALLAHMQWLQAQLRGEA